MARYSIWIVFFFLRRYVFFHFILFSSCWVCHICLSLCILPFYSAVQSKSLHNYLCQMGTIVKEGISFSLWFYLFRSFFFHMSLDFYSVVVIVFLLNRYASKSFPPIIQINTLTKIKAWYFCRFAIQWCLNSGVRIIYNSIWMQCFSTLRNASQRGNKSTSNYSNC